MELINLLRLRLKYMQGIIILIIAFRLMEQEHVIRQWRLRLLIMLLQCIVPMVKTFLLMNIMHKDVCRGIILRKYTYVSNALILLFICVVSFMSVRIWYIWTTIDGLMTLGDVLMYFFKGSPIIDIENAKDFHMTEQYLLLTVCLIMMIGNYIVKDLQEMGTQIILRGAGITRWYISKVVWCFINIALIFLYVWACIILMCVCCKVSLDLKPNMEYMNHIGITSNMIIDAKTMILMVIIIPYISSCALCICQMVLSLYVHPIIAAIIPMIEMVITIFTGLPIMLSNGIMVIRNSIFCENGTNNSQMLLSSIIIISVSFFIGLYRMKRIDIGLIKG